MRGEIVEEEKVLVIRRILVSYRLEADEGDRETIEQVHAFHARFCPVARSITPSIEIETSIELV